MEEIIIGGGFILVVICLLILAIKGDPPLFKKDQNNPYRRYCILCGQRQDEYGLWMRDPHGWWEAMGDIVNKNCKCHHYVK